MQIIKLNATESTNSFLKDLSTETSLSDFTVVITEKQTAGRGQMNSVWVTEPHKNLIFSVYVKFEDLNILNQSYLNFAVSTAIFDALRELNIPKLAVKWPNDILSQKKKICGVLIENMLQGNSINASVIGIGLNVNQIQFPESLPDAASLKMITGITYSLDEVLHRILKKLEAKITLLKNTELTFLETSYLDALYKKNIPSMFKTAENVLFMGKIIGVNTKNGKLQIELSDETVQEFGLKEVSLA